ncbi:MAG: sodium:solute symporter family protein [Stomatobaculum sp.]|nr:sodium:solute symporter family protein [Stomatobaculum sp.]
MGKTALYLGYFCIYSLVLLIIGKSSLRGSSTPQDYFICGHQVTLPFCVCTFTGTWLSAVTILSLTGSIYENGLASISYSVIPWFFGAFLMGLIARKIHRAGVVTVPDYFRSRFGSRSLQIVYGAVFICVYIFYLVTQFKGFGLVASELFNIPYSVSVLMVCLFIMYTTFGGYRSVLRTDMFNLILLTVSLLFLCIALVSRAGGIPALYQAAASISGSAHPGMDTVTEPGQMMKLFSGRFTPMVCFSAFWGWGLGLSANPQYLVRLMSAKDERTAARTLYCSLGLLLLVYVSLVHIGLALRVLVPSQPEAVPTDGIFIHIINHELYGPWSGLFLFSVIGACVSTANSQLLMVAESLSYDIAAPLSGDRLSPSRVVNIARFSVAGAGVLVMLLAMNPPAFGLSYGGDLWGIISVTLFAPLYGSLLTDRVTLRGVKASITAGLLSILAFYPLYYTGRMSLHPAMFGVLFSMAALVIFSGKQEAHKV